MNWDDLKVFLAVARTGSLTAAGHRLKCDAGTVSRRITRLEEAVGAPLFTRSLRGYALTQSGERFLAPAEQAEAATLQLGEYGAADGRGLTGQIRIGAPDGCANYLLPQICAALSRENPGLELHIIAQPRVANLSRREADLAIGVSQPVSGRLRVRKITDYRLFLAGARSYLDSSTAIAGIDDIRTHPIVGYIPDMIYDKELDHLSELGLETAALASNAVSVQYQMLRHGAGLGVVHGFALGFFPELRTVLRDRIELTRSFYLIRHADDVRTGRLNALADKIVFALRTEVHDLEAKLDTTPGSG